MEDRASRAEMKEAANWGGLTTMFRELRVLGAKLDVARQVAANSRRWWRNSGMLLNGRNHGPRFT